MDRPSEVNGLIVTSDIPMIEGWDIWDEMQ